LQLGNASLCELGCLPQGVDGQRLMALRYILANGSVWLTRFAWKAPLHAAVREHITATTPNIAEAEVIASVLQHILRVERLVDQVRQLTARPETPPLFDPQRMSPELVHELLQPEPTTRALRFLLAVQDDAEFRAAAQGWVRGAAGTLHR